MEDHFGEESLSLNLAPKFGLAEITPLTSFFNCLLKSTKVKFMFPIALLPHHEGAK